MIQLVAYLADALILLAYWRLVEGAPARWFHWANALGCFPVIATEVMAGAYPPLVLTVFFGIVGWIGVLQPGHTPEETT